MEACSSVSTLCCSHLAKQPPNPSCLSLHSAIIRANKYSTRANFSVRTSSSSSVINSGSRRRGGAVKSIAAGSPSRGGGIYASLDLEGITPAQRRLPSMEDLDTTNMFLRQRIVFLGTQVDDVSADFVISQLLLLDAEDSTKDIKFFINSPGGSVTAGMGIYDTMKLCKADVSTVCFGLAASMGAFLLAAGTKGKRFCMPNCKVMLHQPYGSEEADSSMYNLILRLRELNYHKIKFNKIYSRITGKSVEQIERDTQIDFFMSAWEAVKYGVADAVIDDGKPGLVAPIGDVTQPPIFGIFHLYTLYDDVDVQKHLPSEEKLMKKMKKGIKKSQSKKDSSGTKDSQQVEEGAPAA